MRPHVLCHTGTTVQYHRHSHLPQRITTISASQNHSVQFYPTYTTTGSSPPEPNSRHMHLTRRCLQVLPGTFELTFTLPPRTSPLAQRATMSETGFEHLHLPTRSLGAGVRGTPTRLLGVRVGVVHPHTAGPDRDSSQPQLAARSAESASARRVDTCVSSRNLNGSARLATYSKSSDSEPCSRAIDGVPDGGS